MKLKFSQLRHMISTVLVESSKNSEDAGPMPRGYYYGNGDTLMLDQEGMEKSDRDNVKRYLTAMGILKV